MSHGGISAVAQRGGRHLQSTGTCTPTTSAATATWYVYDIQGHLTAEYGTPDSSQLTCSTCYFAVDALGSTRAIIDGTAPIGQQPGSLTAGEALWCHDYLPFGEEIPVGIGGRGGCYSGTSTQSGVPPILPPTGVLFTGQYRDQETQGSAMVSGLDYFGARYFSGAMGRFTSPDPFNIMTDAQNRDQFNAYLSNPQNWNRYAYGLNNPLKFIDPLGLDPISVEDCQDKPGCTVVKLNIILDKNAQIYDKNGNLEKSYQDKLDAGIAKAKDTYGNANIALEVGDPVRGTLQGSGSKTGINVFVTGSQDSFVPGTSYMTTGDYAVTVINAGTSYVSTLSHELAHHFTGDTRASFQIPLLSDAIADVNNDTGRWILTNWNTPGGRVLRTLDPFLYLHRQDVNSNARRWFGVQ
jgi:RHS repeat-associated protein